MEVTGSVAFGLGLRWPGCKGCLYCKWGVMVACVCSPERLNKLSSRRQHEFQNDLAMWILPYFSDAISSLACMPCYSGRAVSPAPAS